MTSGLCKECGCRCNNCGNVEEIDDSSDPPPGLDLHQQIAELHSQLQKSNSFITNVEETLQETKVTSEVELSKSREELCRLRERYDRLLESHKKMQKINHDLEDKLLKMVSRFESQKIGLQHELSDMMNRLVDARTLITHLDEENEKYRLDCNMAVQLLQCKPSNFVAHKLNTLPLDLQERVKQMMSKEQLIAAENSAAQQEPRTVRIPIATFPPTAMVYSLQENTKKDPEAPGPESNGEESNHLSGYVPSSLIARALSQLSPRRHIPRSYLCRACRRDVHVLESGCQVDLLTPGSRPVEITTYHHGTSSSSSVGGLGWIHSPPKATHWPDSIGSPPNQPTSPVSSSPHWLPGQPRRTSSTETEL